MQNIIIRNFNLNDIESIFNIYKDEQVNKYLPWYPVKSLKEAKTIFYKKYANKNNYNYAICLKENNLPIGYVHISNSDSYDLGYGLLKEFWHKGITTKAVKYVLNILKENKIPYITATHDINNIRSGYVMKNIGMKYCYSYKELWQPKNILVTFRMYQLNLDGNNNRIYKKYWDKYPEHFIEKNV